MPAVTHNLDEAEQLLFEAEFESVEPVWASSNYVFVASLQAGELTFSAIYKPLRGETPLWDFPPGLYKREVAAYRFSRLLGWPMVPPTIIREGPQGVGSLQLAVSHDPNQHYFTLRDEPRFLPQLKRIAVFDIAANNADRKGGHCLLDQAGRIWGIDHGLCFHESFKLRSVLWDWVGEPIEDQLLEDLDRAAAELAAGSDAARPVTELLSPAEVEAAGERIHRLNRNRCFPEPGPHRHWPWPLV